VIIVDHVVELELVDAPRCGHNTEPVTELHLLQVLFGQVLQVAARKLDMRDDLDLALVGQLLDLDRVAEVAGAALDLDLLVEELFETV